MKNRTKLGFVGIVLLSFYACSSISEEQMTGVGDQEGPTMLSRSDALPFLQSDGNGKPMYFNSQEQASSGKILARFHGFALSNIYTATDISYNGALYRTGGGNTRSSRQLSYL